MLCPRCHVANAATSKYCRQCGASLHHAIRQPPTRPASLQPTQQARIYASFENFLYGITHIPIDDTTRREQIETSRAILQRHVQAGVSQGLPLQEAMLEYLRIRAHEKALRLPQTPVPVVLVPHFQSISHPGLQALVKGLAVFPASTVVSPTSHVLSEGTTSQNAKERFQALLWASQLRLFIKQLAVATGERFDPRYHEKEDTFTVYIMWERSHQTYNYIEVRFDLDGTITIQDASIPLHVWQDNGSLVEKMLEQAYRHPKIYDAASHRKAEHNSSVNW
jgi:hypothetical protein